jgi:hypothetical protein
MKVYLDDVRPAPSGWILTTTVEETIKLLSTSKVVELSLDHDLGIKHTGYDVLLWIETKISIDPNFKPPIIHLHTQNPVGKKRMEAAIKSIKKLSKNK